MGLGDFLGGAAESVGHWVGGVAQGVGAVATHLDDVARGAAWAVNPTHYDDIARGVGHTAEWIGEHPGQIWDTGFEVGRYMVKDQLLDPKNLAINLAMGAATVATAGGATGLLAARVAEMGRAGMGAVSAVRDAEEGVSALRAARTGWEAAKGVEGAAEIAGGAVEAADAASGGGRVSKFLSKADEVMGKEAQWRRTAREAVGLNPEGGFITRQRNALAGQLAERGGLAGQIAAESISTGTARPIIEGSNTGQAISDVMWGRHRYESYKGRIEGEAQSIGSLGQKGRDLGQLNSDPMGFALRKANEHGYDPMGTINTLAQKGETKAANRALKGKAPKRQSSYTDMAGGGGGMYTAPRADGGPTGSIGGGSTTRVTGQGEETVSSQITPMLGRRRSSFYAGTNETYANTGSGTQEMAEV